MLYRITIRQARPARHEILVHTYDAGTGLGESFSPDPRLARRLFRRLFPWLGPGAGPACGPGAAPACGPGADPGSRPVGHAAAGQRADRSPWLAAPVEVALALPPWQAATAELALALRTPGRVEQPASCHRRARAMSRGGRVRERLHPVPRQARRQRARLHPVSFVSVSATEPVRPKHSGADRPGRTAAVRAARGWTTPRRSKSGRSYVPRLRSSAARHRRWSWVGSR